MPCISSWLTKIWLVYVIISIQIEALYAQTSQPTDAQRSQELPIFISPSPLPRCPCPSRRRLTAPGVGFSLDLGYGTASIRHNNGTLQPVVKVSGTPEYVSLMHRLAVSPLERMFDGGRVLPGVDEHDRTTIPIWLWYHTKRWLRKLILRPATTEVRILAEMIQSLRKEVEKELGYRITAVAIASPDRVYLTRYEVGDLFSYLWMEDLVMEKANIAPLKTLYSTSAATAGYGLGLCANYTDPYQCGKEEYFMPASRLLHLDFSQTSLSASVGWYGAARKGRADDSFVDYSLSWRERVQAGPEERKYWESVEERIGHFAAPYRPENVLLTGESAAEPQFIQAVRNALSRQRPSALIQGLHGGGASGNNKEAKEQFLFATSMGAAEFAKRRQEGMAQCWLPKECRGKKGTDECLEVVKEL